MIFLLTSLSTLANAPPPADRCLFKGLAPVACLAAAAAVSGGVLPAPPVDVAAGAAGLTASGLLRIPKMSPSPSMIAADNFYSLSYPGMCWCVSYPRTRPTAEKTSADVLGAPSSRSGEAGEGPDSSTRSERDRDRESNARVHVAVCVSVCPYCTGGGQFFNKVPAVGSAARRGNGDKRTNSRRD